MQNNHYIPLNIFTFIIYTYFFSICDLFCGFVLMFEFSFFLKALEKDMKDYLMEVTGRVLPTQVNEVTGTIRVKGHFDKELKEWLLSKGF